jgi:hypothetical protein
VTAAQLFMFEPIALLFLLGVGMVFSRQINWAVFRHIDRLPPQILGAGFILIAFAFGLLAWWVTP